MSTSEKLDVQVYNLLGYTIEKFWLTHQWVPMGGDSGPIDTLVGENVPSGTYSSPGLFNFRSNSNDTWTLMWIDPQDNVWATHLFFNAEASMDGGSVVVKVQNSGVQPYQGNNGLGHEESYWQYGWGS